MHILKAATSVAVTILVGAASAQVSVPNTFSAGTPARAADVNANFQTLVNAINDLSSRVSRLEGQVTVADLAGTYAIHQFQTELGGGTSQRVAVYTSNGGTATLAPDGTGAVSTIAVQGYQLNLPAGSRIPRSSTDPSGTLTWSLSGGKVNLFGDKFSIADGGRLLIRTSANTVDGTNVLLLLVRIN